MSWTIKESDIPSNIAVHKFILENTDFVEQVKLYKNHQIPLYLKTKYLGDFDLLKEDVVKGLNLYGMYPFKYKNGKIDESYVSTSLTYNSQAIDSLSSNVHEATLGSTLLSGGSYSTNVSDFQKNTYNDTFSFKERTPLSCYGELGKIFDSLKMQLSRSRISKVISEKVEFKSFNSGWHNDESIFLNLRINIPIISSKEHFIQLIINSDGQSLETSEFNLEEGYAYVYNTEINHRPLTKAHSDIDRINLILGISPWISFNSEEKYWYANEYYGKLHPFEIFSNNLISSYF